LQYQQEMYIVMASTGTMGSADVREWQMAGALRRPPASPGCV